MVVWNSKGEERDRHELQGLSNLALSFAISRQGSHIVSGHVDGTVWAWKCMNVIWKSTIRRGQRIVSGSSDTTLRVWTWSGDSWRGIALTDHTEWVLSVGTSGDGNVVRLSARNAAYLTWQRRQVTEHDRARRTRQLRDRRVHVL